MKNHYVAKSLPWYGKIWATKTDTHYGMEKKYISHELSMVVMLSRRVDRNMHEWPWMLLKLHNDEHTTIWLSLCIWLCIANMFSVYDRMLCRILPHLFINIYMQQPNWIFFDFVFQTDKYSCSVSKNSLSAMQRLSGLFSRSLTILSHAMK